LGRQIQGLEPQKAVLTAANGSQYVTVFGIEREKARNIVCIERIEKIGLARLKESLEARGKHMCGIVGILGQRPVAHDLVDAPAAARVSRL
jgi:hypothetical protein